MIFEGKIVNHDSQTYGQVKIGGDGLIEAVGENLGTADLEIPGFIFPGFVDVHVHAREDASGSQNYKEDFRTMSEAAIHGGVVAVCDMPNNKVVPVSDELYEAKQALTTSSLVDILLYGAIVPGSKPLKQNIPYKVYMGPSVGNAFFSSFAELAETVSDYRGCSVSFHCEDPELLAAREKESTHETRRPRGAEISAVKVACDLVERYGFSAKISHISTVEAVEIVAAAKAKNLPITCEVAPHHLYFDTDSLTADQLRLLQVNPPLRTKRDRQALISALKDGVIDYLASDHAPHTREEKKQGISGLPHLDTYGSFITWLMVEQGFTARDIARISAFNPGNFINEFTENKFGRIEAGFVGSLSIVDPDSEITVRREDLKTKCAWSPFEGVRFPGRVTHTVVRGKIYEN